jgi:hypothetical protein
MYGYMAGDDRLKKLAKYARGDETIKEKKIHV